MSVVAPWAQATSEGLGRYLGELWDKDVEVTLDEVASTGARRRNVLFSADDGSTTHKLVATIVPNAALQIQDFMLEPDMVRVAERHGAIVAHVLGATTDESYVGGPFFVTERVEGETVPRTRAVLCTEFAPLDRAADALRDQIERRVAGKVAVVP